MADTFLLEACVQKVLNNRAFFLAENAVLHFLQKEKVHSLACWTRFPTAELLPKSAGERTVAMKITFYSSTDIRRVVKSYKKVKGSVLVSGSCPSAGAGRVEFLSCDGDQLPQ